LHSFLITLHVCVKELLTQIPNTLFFCPIHSFCSCLTTGPLSLPQRTILYFALNFLNPPVSLRSSSSCLDLNHHLPITSILPYIQVFPLITCFRTQYLCKIPPVQLVFLFIVCRIFLSFFTLCNTSSFLSRSIQLIFSILLQHDTSNLSRYTSSTSPSVQF